MLKNYKNIENDIGFITVSKDDISAELKNFAGLYQKLSDEDKATAESFLKTVGITINGDALEVDAVSVWAARAISKKALAAKDLLKIAAKRNIELEDDEIDEIIDAAAASADWSAHVHPFDALKNALDEFEAARKQKEEEAKDEDVDDDEEGGVKGYTFKINF